MAVVGELLFGLGGHYDSRMVVFFFKQKTAYEMRISDWSSDVCSSDLPHHAGPRVVPQHPRDALVGRFGAVADDHDAAVLRVAHPYPAAVVQADPGGAAGAFNIALSSGQL